MAEITAKMVKELREKTGVGMMDCKKALQEANGDAELAIEHLRKAGIAKAAKKAGREAKEGSITCIIKDNAGVMAEVLCETDFVAKNERFCQFATEMAEKVITQYSVDGDVSEKVGEAEGDAVGELVGVLGENIQVRRVVRWETEDKLAYYLHMGGRIGVMIEAAGTDDENLLSDICMHIAAFSPTYIAPEDVPEDAIAKEKEIAAAQVADKPANIVDKIVMGKINKWYTETCLTRQPWIRDDKTSLAKIAPNVTVKRFLRWQAGEEL